MEPATDQPAETESIGSGDILAAVLLPEPPRIPAIGPFELLAPLSTGGMGEVFVARPLGRSEVCAIKLIRTDLSHRTNVRRMFEDEGALLARIDHPGVTSVHAFGEDAGALYLVMEYVAGVRVDELRLPLPPAIAVKMIAEVCRALHAAHEATDEQGQPLEIVHRDVSPRNLILGFDGRMKLIDFGIAFKRDRVSQETELGLLKGRPIYMAPEQFRSERADRRTDVYSACVVLHELLTGEQIFAAPTLTEIVLAVEAGAPPPSELIDGLPDGLDEIVLAGLSYEREDRFENAEQLADALDEIWIREGAPSLESFVAEELFAERALHDLWLAEIMKRAEPAPKARPVPPPMIETADVVRPREPIFNGPIVDRIIREIDRLSETTHEPGARLLLSNLRRAVKNHGVELPPLPEGIVRLGKVVSSPSSEIQDLIRAIQTDPAVSLRFIAVANSTFYGSGREPATTLEKAVLRLGIRQSAMVGMAILSQSRVFAAAGCGRELYLLALAAAASAQVIAEHVPDQDPHRAFLAGLLHDLGRVVLRDGAAQIRCQSRGKQIISASTLEILEQELHPSIGALIASSSKLTPEIVDAILFQHSASRGRPLIEIVAAASSLAEIVLAGRTADPPQRVIEAFARLSTPCPRDLVPRSLEVFRALRA